MTKHYRSNEIEVIPPVRPRPDIVAVPASPAASPPLRQRAGGIISSIPQRWEADGQAKAYDAFARRAVAERKFVEADTELGRALIDNQRMRQEYSELPQICAADKAIRSLRREEEVRALCHAIEVAEARRIQDRARVELDMHTTQQAFVEAEQKLEAQRQYGPRYHALQWQNQINELELRVEEQRTILGEHRRQSGRDDLNLDDLHATRDQLNADGADTTPIDMAIARAMVRQQKARR